MDSQDGAGEAGFRTCAIRELAEEAGIELAEDADLVPFSHWITPEIVPVRFDTWFFLALMPPHCAPQPDGTETTEAAWWHPQAALDAHLAGELELVFPTIRQIESLVRYSTSEEALDTARGLPVEAILPKVVGEGTERRVVLPGDPGYEG